MQHLNAASFIVVFLFIIVSKHIIQTLLNFAVIIRTRLEYNEQLEKIYQASKPLLPEPNELKELTKVTNKNIEELKSWFNTRRSIERSSVRSNRLGESILRFFCFFTSFIFSSELLLNFPVVSSFVLTTAFSLQNLRVALHSSILFQHILSFHSTPKREFFSVLIEMVLRLCLIGVFNENVSEIIAFTHDSVDSLLELSKILDLIGFVTFAKLIFFIFFFLWGWMRLYLTPLMMYVTQDIKLDDFLENNNVLLLSCYLIQLAYDMNGFISIFATIKQACWSTAERRSNRGDSLSSATSIDYESDSSLSSNLKGDF